jgi:hypothetical protein
MIVLDHSPTLATRGIIVYGTSTIYQTIFITKMTVRSGPFSELENDVRQKSRTTFRTGKELPNLDHFPNWKMTAHESIIYISAPSQPGEPSLPFQLRELSPRAPSCPLSTQTLSWTKALSKYLLPAHLWRYTGVSLLLPGLYHE